jgi:energy-coupling factor transport system ATP-binding protein
MEAVIKAENITYTYPSLEGEKNSPAVDGVSIDVRDGEFIAVLGRNGSGKSTLAKLMCMIVSPDSGKLTVAGKDVSSEDTPEKDILEARRDVGMVFQNPDNQIVATVVEEDVAFGPENLGLPSAEIRRRVDEALEMVGMSEYARRQTTALSGGQKQRVAIAGTIAMRRRCVIFDESTAMLDPLGRKEVMDTITRLNRDEGITVILITHYMDEACRAGRVIVMEKGRIISDGTPEETFSDPERMWRHGLDVPQTTELLYRLREAGLYKGELSVFDPEECAARIAGETEPKEERA